MHIALACSCISGLYIPIAVRIPCVNNHNRFLHSTVDGHLGKFHFGSIVNTFVMNILVRVFDQWRYSTYLMGRYPRMEWLNHSVFLCLLMFNFCKYGCSSLFPVDLFQDHGIPKSVGAQVPYWEICVWLNLQMQNPGYGGPNILPNCFLEWLYQLTLPPTCMRVLAGPFVFIGTSPGICMILPCVPKDFIQVRPGRELYYPEFGLHYQRRAGNYRY